MITDKLKELEAARAKLAALEQSLAAERNAELAALPTRYGFDSVDAFIAAVRAASGKRRGRQSRVKSGGSKPIGRRKKRATITDEMRAEVKKLVEAGKTAPEIAKTIGISEPSVANVKRALGLVKKRK